MELLPHLSISAMTLSSSPAKVLDNAFLNAHPTSPLFAFPFHAPVSSKTFLTSSPGSFFLPFSSFSALLTLCMNDHASSEASLPSGLAFSTNNQSTNSMNLSNLFASTKNGCALLQSFLVDSFHDTRPSLLEHTTASSPPFVMRTPFLSTTVQIQPCFLPVFIHNQFFHATTSPQGKSSCTAAALHPGTRFILSLQQRNLLPKKIKK